MILRCRVGEEEEDYGRIMGQKFGKRGKREEGGMRKGTRWIEVGLRMDKGGR